MYDTSNSANMLVSFVNTNSAKPRVTASMEQRKHFGYPVVDVGTGTNTQPIACACRRMWAILRT